MAGFVIHLIIYLLVLLGLAQPLGGYMAWVFERSSTSSRLSRWERKVIGIFPVDLGEEMSWVRYAKALLIFSGIGIVFVFVLQRIQEWGPVNPEKFGGVPADLAFNTAVSFVTNTNWQAYSGEASLSYFTQMFGLSVQNFLSAATGIAVLFALFRGFIRVHSSTIGNFWRDLIFTTIYILLPLSVILAVLLVSQGVVQSFEPYVKVSLLEPVVDSGGATVSDVDLPLGPVASQVAIKQLGTNGGGFFGTNSAHPFENPTPFSNFLELISILLIPAALCVAFGRVVGDARQGRAILASMVLLFTLLALPTGWSELMGNPLIDGLGDSQSAAMQSAGNMEGKEMRFGVADSAIWAAATTAASNGSVNAMHDSFTPMGGAFPLLLMQLGEVVFGGVGSGLYGMLAFAILAVFVAGLMVGRTPEYLGKKIGAFEMKMVSLVILFPCAVVLVATALGVSSTVGVNSISNPGPHGFTQMLYAYSSMGNNNGSAFAGLGANNALHNLVGSVVMFVSRFWVIIPTLALASSLARKQSIPMGSGTLETHTPLFVVLLSGTVLLVGALTFIPSLALGPIVEAIELHSMR